MNVKDAPASDSAPVPFEAHKRRPVKFDPTINLGHILTFIGFIASGSVAYFDLRERIAVHDVRIQQIDTETNAEEGRIRDTLRELRDDVREVRRGVDQLAQRKP